MNQESTMSEPTVEEIESIVDRIRSEETLLNEDIPTLINTLDRSIEAHVNATEGLLILTEQQERILEKEYPDIVEALLSSRQSLVIAGGLLHGLVSLRVREIPVQSIESGLSMAREKLVDYIDKISEGTPGSEEVVPGGGSVPFELGLRLNQYADSVAGREQLVIEEAGNALKGVPGEYAKQVGADPYDTVTEIQARVGHEEGVKLGVSDSGQVSEMDGDSNRVSTDQVFRYCYNGIGAVHFILHFERTPSQLLRSEAVLTEELR